jgi:tetratricopeptide (TPR) repeat protein
MGRRQPLPLLLFFFAATAACLAYLAYAPGLKGDYIFDDFPNLLENRALHLQTLDVDSLLSASLSSSSGILKRPISMLSFALNYYFFGKDPYSFKMTNLVLHVLNGIGLFILSYCLLSISRNAKQLNLSARQVPWLSAIVALIWLAHPINLTGVLYIVQRMASLSSFFVIYGLVFYIWYRNRLFRMQGKLYVLLAGCTTFLVLATLSKESGALFPLYLLLTESLLFKFKNADGKFYLGTSVSFSLFVIVPLIALIVWLLLNPSFILGGYATRDFTFSERVFTESRVITTYLSLIIAPSISELGLFHDDLELSRGLYDPPATLASILFLASLVALALYTARRVPLLSYGLLWFFIGHLLESTVYPLEIMHEHRNYLASYGIILPIVVVLFSVFDRFQMKMLRMPLAILAILIFASATFFRASQWESNISLALSEAEHHPNSPRATYAVARIYAKLVLDGGEKQLSGDTMRRLETAISIGKRDIKPDIALLIFASKTGQPIKDEWLRQLRRKIISWPITPSEINGLKQFIQCQRDSCNVPVDEVNRLFETSLESRYLRPDSQLRADLITVYADFALNNLQDYALTERLFQQAITISPAEPQYRINYIRLLIASGRIAEAGSQLEILARLDTLGNLSSTIKELTEKLSAIAKPASYGYKQSGRKNTIVPGLTD